MSKPDFEAARDNFITQFQASNALLTYGATLEMRQRQLADIGSAAVRLFFMNSLDRPLT